MKSIQFEDATVQLLTETARDVGAEDWVEAVRWACALLQLIGEEQLKGAELFFRHADGSIQPISTSPSRRKS